MKPKCLASSILTSLFSLTDDDVSGNVCVLSLVPPTGWLVAGSAVNRQSLTFTGCVVVVGVVLGGGSNGGDVSRDASSPSLITGWLLLSDLRLS